MLLRLKNQIHDYWLQLITYRAYLRGKTILPQKIRKKISVLDTLGITHNTRPIPIIISLTTFPERIREVPCVIYSLFNQTCKADKIILWLAEEEFPNHNLPKELYIFQKYGLEIKWTTNLYSFKKIIPTLVLYPNAIIVTADDDIYYPTTWLEKLYYAYQSDSKQNILNKVYAHRAHHITLTESLAIKPYNEWKSLVSSSCSILNFGTQCGGMLYPPP